MKILILKFSKLCPKTRHHHHSWHYLLLYSLAYHHLPPVLFFQFRLEKPHPSSILSLGSHPWSFISGTVWYRKTCLKGGKEAKSATLCSLWSFLSNFFHLTLLILLTFVPYTKQTNSSSWSKKSPCRSGLVLNFLKQVKHFGHFSIICEHFFFASLEKRW